MRSFLAVLISAGMIVSFLVVVASHNSPTKQYAQHAKSDQATADNSTTIPLGKASEDSSKTAANSREKKKQSFMERFFEFSLTDAVIAIFTIVIGTTTICLFRAEKETARHELRAYVGFEDIFFIFKGNHVVDGPRRKFSDVQKLRFWNFGKTPATEVIFRVMRAKEMPKYIPAGEAHHGPRILQPGQRHGVRRKLEHGFSHKDRFFTYGWISYQDIYDRWWTCEFAWLYEPQTPHSPEGRGEFTPYERYNQEYKGKKRPA